MITAKDKLRNYHHQQRRQSPTPSSGISDKSSAPLTQTFAANAKYKHKTLEPNDGDGDGDNEDIGCYMDVHTFIFSPSVYYQTRLRFS